MSFFTDSTILVTSYYFHFCRVPTDYYMYCKQFLFITTSTHILYSGHDVRHKVKPTDDDPDERLLALEVV